MFNKFFSSKPTGRRVKYQNSPAASAEDDHKGAFRRHKPDYWLLIVPLALLTLGLIVVYSISPGLAAAQETNQNYYVTKQFIAIGMGIAAFLLSE